VSKRDCFGHSRKLRTQSWTGEKKSPVGDAPDFDSAQSICTGSDKLAIRWKRNGEDVRTELVPDGQSLDQCSVEDTPDFHRAVNPAWSEQRPIGRKTHGEGAKVVRRRDVAGQSADNGQIGGIADLSAVIGVLLAGREWSAIGGIIDCGVNRECLGNIQTV